MTDKPKPEKVMAEDITGDPDVLLKYLSGFNEQQADRLSACIDLIGHTGAKTLQMRFSEDEEPAIWFVVVEHAAGDAIAVTVGASTHPLFAFYDVVDKLIDGGRCTHCHRPTAFDPDGDGVNPLEDKVCWYQYSPAEKKFMRGCYLAPADPVEGTQNAR
jgi:hypothetical protein